MNSADGAVSGVLNYEAMEGGGEALTLHGWLGCKSQYLPLILRESSKSVSIAEPQKNVFRGTDKI